MRLLFRLPFWVFVALGIACFPLGVMVQNHSDKKRAEHVEALRIGPPEMVPISEFRKDTHAGPADEVTVLAQLDLSMRYNLTYSKKNKVKAQAHIIPLYAVDATSTDPAPIAIFFEEAKRLDIEKVFDMAVGSGEIGPIIELNGQLTRAGDLSSLMRGAFEDERRAYDSKVPLIDPFMIDRTQELTEGTKHKPVGMVMYAIGGILLLIGGIKYLFRRRAKRNAQANPAMQPSAAE